ncbi:MAG: lipid-A-disaccharide synthase [Bacteroidetes bacterium]|jgi:lipid-A-disaccharide synthase|nr:lipid-A-disaccharide synthase [Bacteroidota bacterium]
MKYYIVAGEASGDMHAANLAAELHKADHDATMRGWGGDRMQAAGVEVVKHYRELAFMGFIEVVKNLRTIFRNLEACKADILKFNPDVVILVDYPGFNLRLAEFLKLKGIKVFYYISPQIWAWKQSRVHKIKRTVDKMFVILPFEKPFYKKFDYDVEFTGHPLLDEIERIKKSAVAPLPVAASGKKIIALLPGSRIQEIKEMLPVMANAVKHFKNYEPVIAAAPNIPDSFYQSLAANISIVHGQTYNLLQQAYAALVTSGTATLETALFRVPEIVCYKGNKFSYLIARQLVKVKYISLVNLILDRMLVKELIQQDMNEKTLTAEMELMLENDEYRKKLSEGYEELIQKLGSAGASAKAAQKMYNLLLSEKGK